jgi:hypothetical protein
MKVQLSNTTNLSDTHSDFASMLVTSQLIQCRGTKQLEHEAEHTPKGPMAGSSEHIMILRVS